MSRRTATVLRVSKQREPCFLNTRTCYSSFPQPSLLLYHRCFFVLPFKLHSFHAFYSIGPLPFVDPPIGPEHFTVTVPIIVLERTFVVGAVMPSILTLSTFLIVHILSFVAVAI